ncbi:MAG: isochorismate synthase [Microbacteriaceae bacterium]
MTTSAAPTVTVESLPTARTGTLLDFASPIRPLYYRHRDIEIVGIGELCRWSASGEKRFDKLGALWREFVATIPLESRHHAVALASGSFDPLGTAELVVPRTAIVRRGRDVTVVSFADSGPAVEPVRRTVGSAPVVEWPHIDSVYRDRVRSALARLTDGLEKVVVARALTGAVTSPGDERAPLERLTVDYPDTHIFAFDGLWGASPETLVDVVDTRVHARVLAGSAARGWDSPSDGAAASGLAASTKDRDEHAYAVRSVVTALSRHCRAVIGAAVPFTLRLTNVWHLASDITAVLAPRSTIFELVDSLHPTAAVAGVPTDIALRTISEVEAIPRNRYAGPVGWVDARGNGEFAIALRCAQWTDEGIVAHAGAGIIADSDPESEYAETELKFRPIREALAP